MQVTKSIEKKRVSVPLLGLVKPSPLDLNQQICPLRYPPTALRDLPSSSYTVILLSLSCFFFLDHRDFCSQTLLTNESSMDHLSLFPGCSEPGRLDVEFASFLFRGDPFRRNDS
jgi:hypothetical protein